MAKDYKHMALQKNDRQALIERAQRTLKSIHISEKGLSYIADVLSFIHDEELCYPHRQKGRYMPYPWELKDSKTLLSSETSLCIKKRINGEYTAIDIKDAPECIMNKMKDFLKTLLEMKANQFARGKIDTICNLMPFTDDGESYIIPLKNTLPLNNIGIESIKKNKKGRRGEPQSDMAMYLLYRYFKGIKLKEIYQTIATLCTEVSTLFFCKGIGSPLTPETVRKRIQWTKTRKHIVEYVEGFERRTQ
jgi:hypothetical protein